MTRTKVDWSIAGRMAALSRRKAALTDDDEKRIADCIRLFRDALNDARDDSAFADHIRRYTVPAVEPVSSKSAPLPLAEVRLPLLSVQTEAVAPETVQMSESDVSSNPRLSVAAPSIERFAELEKELETWQALAASRQSKVHNIQRRLRRAKNRVSELSERSGLPMSSVQLRDWDSIGKRQRYNRIMAVQHYHE